LEDLRADNGSIVEENVRQIAGSKFGLVTASSFLLRSIYDLANVSLPHGTSQDDIQFGVIKLTEIAKVTHLPIPCKCSTSTCVQKRFPEYVLALQEEAKNRYLRFI
jgi:hypothetical protein